MFMDKLNSFCDIGKEYKLVTWNSYDNKPKPSPIYHTNVVMAVLDKHIICCLDSIHDKIERERVLKEMNQGRKVINISYDEMNNMCGNMI